MSEINNLFELTSFETENALSQLSMTIIWQYQLRISINRGLEIHSRFLSRSRWDDTLQAYPNIGIVVQVEIKLKAKLWFSLAQILRIFLVNTTKNFVESFKAKFDEFILSILFVLFN